MSFNTECPFCHQKVQAEEEWQGQQAECPACSKIFVIIKPQDNILRPIINVQINNENQFSKGYNNQTSIPPSWSAQTPCHVPNHMTKAILATLFCCMPFGIISMVYATKANDLVLKGNYNEAKSAADTANMWFWISFIIGFVLSPFVICASIFGQ